VKIVLLRKQNLSIGAKVQIYFDNGNGQIDYTKPLDKFPIKVWPQLSDKAGFGLSRFGSSDFGYDLSAAIGFARGIFGEGFFGADTDAIEWISEELSAGIYKFGVAVIDEKGNRGESTETNQVIVIPSPKPGTYLGVRSFEKATNQLTLSIS
jgi:hypothetical protein